MRHVKRDDRTKRYIARRPRDVVSLYESVREVALLALERLPSVIDPRRITQDEWDETKRRSRAHHDLPNANEICRQLGGRGAPLPWRHILEVAFDDARSSERVHTALAATPHDLEISEDDVFFSLNRVAHELGTEFLSITDYVTGYNRLVARDRRRKNGGHLEQQLLTLPQIRWFAGEDWRRACAIADLRPALDDAYRPQRGTPTVDALIRVYEQCGKWPSEKRLRRYAKEHGFALENRPRDRGWHAYVDDARNRLQELTGLEPAPYDPRDQPNWDAPVSAAPADLPKTKRRNIPRPEVLLHVIAFVESRGRGKRPTQPEWWAYAREHRAPSTRVLDLHGGLEALVKEASKPGARKRAERELEEIRNPTPEQKEAQRARSLEERANTPQAHAVLEAISATGGGTARELAAHLGWDSVDTVRVWLRPLKSTGRVKTMRVHDDDGAPVEQYVLATAAASAPLENDPDAIRAATTPAGRRGLAAVETLGSATPRRVAEHLGIGAARAGVILSRLADTGFVNVDVQGHSTGRGRELVYTRTAKPLPEGRGTKISPLRWRVLELVRELEPARVPQIAQAIGKSAAAANWHLTQLVDDGYLERHGTGELRGGGEMMEYRATGKKPPANAHANG